VTDNTATSESARKDLDRLRIHELASRLGIPASDVMHRAQALDLGVRTVLQSLHHDDLLRVLEDYETPSNGANGAVPDPDRVTELITAIGGPETDRATEDAAEIAEGDQAESTENRTEAAGTEPTGVLVEESILDGQPDPQPEAETPEATVSEKAETPESGQLDESEGAELPTAAEPPELAAEPIDDDQADLLEALLDADTWFPKNVAPAATEVAEPSVPDEAVSTWKLPTNQRPRRRALPMPEPRQPDVAAPEPTHDENSGKKKPITKRVMTTLYSWLRAVASAIFSWTLTLTEKVQARIWGQEHLDRPGGAKQRRRLVAAALVIVAGTAVLTTTYAVLNPMHAAESEVIVSTAGVGTSEVGRELQSFLVVAESQPVLAPVAEELDIPLSELRDSFQTEIIGDSAVLRFLVTDADAERALVINDAILTSYLEVANRPTDQDQLAFLDSQIAAVRLELDETAQQLEALEATQAVADATRLTIETDRSIAQNRLATFESRLVDLQSSGEPPAGAISFVETQIVETRETLEALAAELATLDSPESAAAAREAQQLRDAGEILRSELGQLEARKVDLGLSQIAGPRVSVLAPAHALDDPVGLTPVRAVALGLLVGGIVAFAYVLLATQLNKRP
jgi:capsular polysaccharide biosynthesis protein